MSVVTSPIPPNCVAAGIPARVIRKLQVETPTFLRTDSEVLGSDRRFFDFEQSASAIVRNKAMAMILGQAGVGLFGIYGLVNDLTRSIAGMGVNSSGVRQIAEAVGTGDAQRIARTVTVLRRVAFCSGALGALLLLVLCKPISWLTFKDYRHTGSVALLALAVFFGDISQGTGGSGARHAPDCRPGPDECAGSILWHAVQHPHRLFFPPKTAWRPRWCVWRRWAFSPPGGMPEKSRSNGCR